MGVAHAISGTTLGRTTRALLAVALAQLVAPQTVLGQCGFPIEHVVVAQQPQEPGCPPEIQIRYFDGNVSSNYVAYGVSNYRTEVDFGDGRGFITVGPNTNTALCGGTWNVRETFYATSPECGEFFPVFTYTVISQTFTGSTRVQGVGERGMVLATGTSSQTPCGAGFSTAHLVVSRNGGRSFPPGSATVIGVPNFNGNAWMQAPLPDCGVLHYRGTITHPCGNTEAVSFSTRNNCPPNPNAIRLPRRIKAAVHGVRGFQPGEVDLEMDVSGTPGWTYRWVFLPDDAEEGENLANGVTPRGSVLSNATTGKLHISNLQDADAGTYTIIAIDPATHQEFASDTMRLVFDSDFPDFESSPSDVTIGTQCSAAFSVVATGSGLSYQWIYENGANPAVASSLTNGEWIGMTIAGAQTPTLTLSNLLPSHAGRVYCIVSNASGSNESHEARLAVCAADFNCDGFLDGFDYDDFVACFEGDPCPPGKSADFNNDGFPDGFDYDDFVTAFETGCQ